jgi:hypothetical protein
VKNHDFTPKIIFFSILGGGGPRRVRPPPLRILNYLAFLITVIPETCPELKVYIDVPIHLFRILSIPVIWCIVLVFGKR